MPACPAPVTILAMDAPRIDRQQAAALHHALAPRLRWMLRLCQRMERLGIDPSDPLRLAAYEAYNALHNLAVRAHYRSCESGVGEACQYPGREEFGQILE